MGDEITITNRFCFASLAVLCFSLAPWSVLAAPASVRLPSASISCKLNVLKKLGWTIEDSNESSPPRILDAGICSSAGASVARAGGLQLKMSNLEIQKSPSRISNELNKILTSSQSQCAFSHLFERGLERGTTRLQNNSDYTFTFLAATNTVRKVPGWKQVDCSGGGPCVQVAGDIAQAVRNLYNSNFSSECASGLMLALYAGVYETFGDSLVNKAFKPEEFFVGDWNSVRNSRSIVSSDSVRQKFDPTGLQNAQAGAAMMSGMTGYIGNVKGMIALNALADQGENFVIIKTSDAGARSFVTRGGADAYRPLFEEIYNLVRDLDLGAQQWLESDRDPSWSSNGHRAYLLMQDAFLHDTVVYVHDVGSTNISHHLARLARMNPGSPYKLQLNPDTIHAEVFARYLESQLDACSK